MTGDELRRGAERDVEMAEEDLKEPLLQKRKPSMLIHSLYNYHMKTAGYQELLAKKQPSIPKPLVFSKPSSAAALPTKPTSAAMAGRYSQRGEEQTGVKQTPLAPARPRAITGILSSASKQPVSPYTYQTTAAMRSRIPSSTYSASKTANETFLLRSSITPG